MIKLFRCQNLFILCFCLFAGLCTYNVWSNHLELGKSRRNHTVVPISKLEAHRLRSSNGTSLAAQPYFDLLIIIPAHATDFERRNAVRSSWARYIDDTGFCASCRSNRTTKLLFLMDKGNVSEGPDVGILPSSGKEDTYRDLAHKVKRCIAYAIQNYRFTLLLKADVDTFVFLDRLLKYLSEQNLFRHGIYAGGFGFWAKPIEEPSHPNYDDVFKPITGRDYFPFYSSGSGYLLSIDLCRFLSLASLQAMTDRTKLPNYVELRNEDVSVGFWLEAVRHERHEIPMDLLNHGCDNDYFLIDHYVKPEEMKDRWEWFLETGNPCGGKDVYDLLIVIPSQLELDRSNRDLVRNTWARLIGSDGRCITCDSSRQTKLLFIVSEAKEKAMVSEDDVLVLPSIFATKDQPAALSHKLRHSFKFLLQKFKFKLLLKVQIDTFVFIDRLLTHLNSNGLFRDGIYAGWWKINSAPVEDPRSPWFDGTFRPLTGRDYFAKYALGGGYILSADLCRFISMGAPQDVNTSELLPQLIDLPNEDTAIGWWLEAVQHEKWDLGVNVAPHCCDLSQRSWCLLETSASNTTMEDRWLAFERTGDFCADLSDVNATTTTTGAPWIFAQYFLPPKRNRSSTLDLSWAHSS